METVGSSAEDEDIVYACGKPQESISRIEYIETNWSTLYSELIEWNTQWGDSLNSQITAAWEGCCSAVDRYNGFLNATLGIAQEIASVTAQIAALDEQIANASSSSSSSKNSVVASKKTTTPTTEDQIHAVISEMYSNTIEHGGASSNTSTEKKKELNERNYYLGYTELPSLGVSAYRSTDGYDWGTWYTDSSKSQLLYDKYKQYIYHKGGIAGDGGSLKDNEVLAKLEKGETVLTTKMWDNLTSMVEHMDTLSKAFSKLPDYAGTSILPDSIKLDGTNSISNVTNTNNRPVEISIGDTIIQGNASQETIQQHVKVTYDMVDQIAKLLKIGR